MSNLSTSWEDEPAHIYRPSESESFTRSANLAKPHSSQAGLKRKKRVSLDEIILQVSAGSKPLVTSMAEISAPETFHESPAVQKKSEHVPDALVLTTVAEPRLPAKEHADKGVVRSETVVPLVSEEPRKRKRAKKETANENPDKTIAATSSNVVFQDLKSKGGTKSNKGAENLRRRISRARNERWREANGFRRKGKRAAQYRREQISREMAHEKNLLEAVNEQNVVEMFSQGVDREIIQRLLGEKSEDDPNSVFIQPNWPGENLGSVCREELEKFLSDEFNYECFRPGQFEAISSVLSGSRSLIVLPTGAGKSLCYQFPSVFLRKKFKSNFLTIVVSPLIALMSDQLKLLPSCCRGAALHSNLSPTQTSLVFSAVQTGLIDVLFLAPERMLMYSMKDVFAKSSVLLVAIDEAHCLSEWSHSFRPAYMSLPKILDFDIKPKSILALTATATIQTVDSLRSVLSLNNVIRTDGIGGPSSSCSNSSQVQRKNLELFAKRSHNPVMDLLEFLTRPEMKGVGPIIVYVNYKWQTENVSQVLRERGLGAAEGYHGGLSAVERKEIHEKFIHNEVRFVVATVAFGMGIDKKNVRSVVHLTVPKSIENYVQETGRCSRDNQLGRCRCYFNAEDYSRIRNKMVQDALKIEGVENLLKLHILPNYASRKCLVFIPETIESVSKQHMSLLLALAESFGLGTVFQGFPRIVKLRFFSSSLEDLSQIDPFVNILYTSPKSGEQSTVSQSGGVATVDIVSAIEKSGGLTPPQFMHQLSVTAKAQKFTVAKSEWGHIFIPFERVENIGSMHEVCEKIYQTAIANHLLELNRLDASFALLSRIAAESIDNETIGHSLIQAYFEAEERISTGEDLVQSVLQDASPAIARSVLREIDSLRNCN